MAGNPTRADKLARVLRLATDSENARTRDLAARAGPAAVARLQAIVEKGKDVSAVLAATALLKTSGAMRPEAPGNTHQHLHLHSGQGTVADAIKLTAEQREALRLRLRSGSPDVVVVEPEGDDDGSSDGQE